MLRPSTLDQTLRDATAVLESVSELERLRALRDPTAKDTGDWLEHWITVATLGVFKTRAQCSGVARADGVISGDFDGYDSACHLDGHGVFGLIEAKNFDKTVLGLGDVCVKYWRFANYHAMKTHPSHLKMRIAAPGKFSYTIGIGDKTRVGFDVDVDLAPVARNIVCTGVSGIASCHVGVQEFAFGKRDVLLCVYVY